MARTVRWYECTSGHQFAVVAETTPEDRKPACPGCGTVEMTFDGKVGTHPPVPLPLPKVGAITVLHHTRGDR